LLTLSALPVTADNRDSVIVGPKLDLFLLETFEIFGDKRGQSEHLKASFHLEVLKGILDVAASCDKVLNGSPTIAYETGQ